MRQDIAYVLIALMLAAAVAVVTMMVRRSRRRGKGNLRVDLLKRDEH